MQWRGGVVYYEESFPNLLFAKDGEINDLDQNAVLRYAVSDPPVRARKEDGNLRGLCGSPNLRKSRHDSRQQRGGSAESGNVTISPERTERQVQKSDE